MISGVFGWLVMVVAGRQLGPEGYARFSVAWGVFFGVGGAFSGIQQETTRAVRTAADHTSAQGVRALRAALTVAAAFVLMIALLSPAWGPSTFSGKWPTFLVTLTVGWLSLSIYMFLNGALAAQGRWNHLAWSIAGDQVLRLALVALVLSITDRVSVILWAVVGGTLIWFPMLVSADVRRAFTAFTGQSLAGFARRGTAAMVSAGCAALMIGGFPFLVQLTAHKALGPSTGVVFAAVLLTRSPILLPLYGLRPVLLVWLISHRDGIRGRVHRGLLLGFAVGLGLSALAYMVGPAVLAIMFGADYAASRPLMSGLTAGAVMIMLLTVSGLTLISVDRHSGSTRGWLLALAISTAALALPISLEARSALAVTLGPGCGVLWHLLELRGSVQTEREG
jgi:O-antigen/teichoic acid export membrane protein